MALSTNLNWDLVENLVFVYQIHFSTDLSLISEMLQILLYIIWIFIFLNFGEEFCWTFPSSINFLFLKSNSEIGTPTLDRHTSFNVRIFGRAKKQRSCDPTPHDSNDDDKVWVCCLVFFLHSSMISSSWVGIRQRHLFISSSPHVVWSCVKYFLFIF